MRTAIALQHRRQMRRLAYRRWQASHLTGPEGHGEPRTEASPNTSAEGDATAPPSWPQRAGRAVADSVRAHPVAWLLGAAGFGAGCALFATMAKHARTKARQAPPDPQGEEHLALACRMDCAELPDAALRPLPCGVQVAVTLVPLATPA